MLKMQSMFRKELAAIAQADTFADAEEVAAFVADMKVAGFYGEATEDEIERLDEII